MAYEVRSTINKFAASVHPDLLFGSETGPMWRKDVRNYRRLTTEVSAALCVSGSISGSAMKNLSMECLDLRDRNHLSNV